MNRETILSPDRVYRYTLWRPVIFNVSLLDVFVGDPPTEKQKSYVNFICLNPSTADETQDDPTIRRVVGFAKSWGYGAVCMTNLFAFRATDPDAMKRHAAPTGAANDAHLIECAANAGIVIAGWGANGNHLFRANDVKRMMAGNGVQLHALHINSDGSPKHPLYVKADTVPQLFQ